MNRRFLTYWLGLSLALHLLAAIFSTGYQNSDEHFQILEFLNYRLGLTPPQDLAIEFHRMMRPWLQPALYYVPTLFLKTIGIRNPFIWATVIRLISALIGWASVVGLALGVQKWIRDPFWQKAVVVTLALTWFLPVLHARHSSENLSGALFTIALGLTPVFLGHGGRLRHGFWLGALMGLAFEVRYQVAVMILGWAFWIYFFGRVRGRALFGIGAGLLLALALGTLIDFWGYGRPCFAPWNYFSFNLLEGRLDAGGVSPWWDYFRRIWTETWPIIAPAYLFGTIWMWIRYPRHLLTWSLAPLFLFHLVIGHKETRFLFPMAHAAPVALVLGLQAKRNWLKLRRYRIMAAVFGVLNVLALLILCLSPASMPIRFYEFVYDKKIRELNYQEKDPYIVLGIPMDFYRPAGLVTRDGAGQKADSWLFLPHHDAPAELSKRCRREFSIYPQWIRSVDRLDLMKNVNDWSLFLCNPA